MFSCITRSLRMLNGIYFLLDKNGNTMELQSRNLVMQLILTSCKPFLIPLSEVYLPPLFGTSNKPLSGPSEAHYSFYFAQQVHYPCPSDPWQPGPMYFNTPQKCGLFGIHCEGLPRQVNYLIDEASATGKGTNMIISYLHMCIVYLYL